MEATPSFLCAQCGTAHEGYPTDRAYTLPDDVWAIPKADLQTRAEFTPDLCAMDGRCFIRGVLFIPLIQREDNFGWGVWAEVDNAVFEHYREIFDLDGSDEPTSSGVLANAIPGYEDAANERVIITFGSPSARPTFDLEPHSQSSLAKDQRTGIDERRYHAMLVAAGAI